MQLVQGAAIDHQPASRVNALVSTDEVATSFFTFSELLNG